MLKDCEISTHSLFLSPTLNPEATPITHALPTRRGERGDSGISTKPAGARLTGGSPDRGAGRTS